MGNSNPANTEFLKTVLEPLLDEFQYWFDYSCQMLENEKINFMSDYAQCNLLQRIKQAQEELRAAKSLLKATDGQVGIGMAILMPRHQLVNECWNVGIRRR